MKTKILVVDDDMDVRSLLSMQFVKHGYEVRTLSDSSKALNEIKLFKPDVVLTDIMMPNVDGYSLTKQIKENKDLRSIKIIVVSAKRFEFDYKRALDLGADDFLIKPITSENFKILNDKVDKVLNDRMVITFWGTRGTIPRGGKETLIYGYNTPCVTVDLTKNRLFIFDAGTGIAELGNHLAAQNKRLKMNLFITHPHWDHIHGFPFFKPLYAAGNELAVYGSPHGDITLREVISGQMESIYFPITIKEFAARVYFKDLSEGEYEIEKLSIQTINLNHPGVTLGYRLTNSSGKSMAYITDNELVPGSFDESGSYDRIKLVKFLKNVDVLIHEASYFDNEYHNKAGWGHSPITEVLKLAEDAEVKSVYLFHHDPDHNDAQILELETLGKNYFKERDLNIQCFAAAERKTISL